MITNLDEYREIKNTDQSAQAMDNNFSPDYIDDANLALQFKIVLKQYKPLIWRRVLVPADWTFLGLHAVVQACFEWNGSHLHNFRFGRDLLIEMRQSLEQMDITGINRDVLDEEETSLTNVFTEYNKGIYTYDLNEDFEHEIIFEKVLPRENSAFYPRCLKFKGTAPADETYEMVGSDIDTVNKRLELLSTKDGEFKYVSPYRFSLHDCLGKNTLAALRQIARNHRLRSYSTLKKADLVKLLEEELPQRSVSYLLSVVKQPSLHNLLLLTIAQASPDNPLDLDGYFNENGYDKYLEEACQELQNLGFIYDLRFLDPDLLPYYMSEDPDQYYPILIMPGEIKQKTIQTIEKYRLDQLMDVIQDYLNSKLDNE